ncbi:MAG: aminoacyl-tRNA hydrolase [Gammaproteobacteria bacterium]
MANATTAIQLVVGLGNPGPGHAGDRHNVGFWLVDALAASLGAAWRAEARFKGELARAGSGLRLLKPMTFMNLSGESVAACAAYFRVPPAAIVVVHDELDLPAGAVRLKRGGGHGGHNGLRSIDRLLGSTDYIRLRLGIGRPGTAGDVTGHVLGAPPAAERQLLETTINFVLDNVDCVLEGDLARAMNILNRRTINSEEDI